MKEKQEFRVRETDKEKAIHYFDSVSQDYNNTVSWGVLRIPRERERRAVLEYAELNRGGLTVADVGCGSGFYSLQAKRSGMIVHSFDTSPGMIQKLAPLVDKCQVADIEKMDTSQQYDTVICAGVLDFVLQPEIAFSNLCKMVAEGGRLVILCPRVGMGGLFYRLEKYFFGIRINLYESRWLSSFAQKEGLKLEKISYPLPTNMALLFRRHSPCISS